MKEKLKTQITDTYDVAVCGGGFAGISAALSAARAGKKVVLIEKQFMLGGLGTAGIVTIYLPLCDGFGRQVSFGIAEELLRLSIKHGAEDRYPKNWLDGEGTKTDKDARFEVQYNPQLFAILVEDLLQKAGVDILYGTSVVGVKVKKSKISHILLENKSGRSAYAVKSVVDTTGDCDIAKQAGAPTALFEQGNVLAAWYYSYGKDGYQLHMVGFADIPDEDRTGDEPKPLINKRFSGLDGKELSMQTCLSHRSTYADFLKKREKDDGILPVTMATTPQIRMTRRIVGEYELSNKEEHTRFEDSIGLISNWKKRGPVYEVPFRTLYSAKVKNLITAGRSISVNEPMWDVSRVIPCCAVTGEAAGLAAAMTDDFTTLNIVDLQQKLRKAGVVIHENELPPVKE